jgi:hypothetical protein
LDVKQNNWQEFEIYRLPAASWLMCSAPPLTLGRAKIILHWWNMCHVPIIAITPSTAIISDNIASGGEGQKM